MAKLNKPFVAQLLQNAIGVDAGDADGVADILLGQGNTAPSNLHQSHIIGLGVQLT